MKVRQYLPFFGSSAQQQQLSETAWLNGVRGLAAVLVMMGHYSTEWMSSYADAPFGALISDNVVLSEAWYFRKGQRLWAFWRLPIFRVFMTDGGGQVALFFIISGFVLTWSPLAQTQQDKLLRSLGSSTFRRWFRLYIPCGIVTLPSVLNDSLIRYDSILPIIKSFWDYFFSFLFWANPFRTIPEAVIPQMQGYNMVVWTIPHEFHGSLFVYTLVLALGRFHYPQRLALTLLVTIVALCSTKWDFWLFGVGMALADYTRQSKVFDRPSSTRSTWLWSACLVVGLILLGYPGGIGHYTKPGYELFSILPLPSSWREEHEFDLRLWWGCGATLIMTATCHLKHVRRFFELSILQYFGKISFMLYLIHVITGYLVGGLLQGAIYKQICTYEYVDDFVEQICRISMPLHVCILVSLWILTVPILLIVAHILEITVDRPCTALGKKLDDLLLRSWTKSEVVEVVEAPEEEQLLRNDDVEDLEMRDVSSDHRT